MTTTTARPGIVDASVVTAVQVAVGQQTTHVSAMIGALEIHNDND